MINQPNVSGTVALFTNSTGMERHFSVRLWAEHASGSGSSVSIRVNGVEAPLSDGFTVNVSAGVPVREKSEHLLLADGDVVDALVQGGNVNLKVGVSVDTDEYA